MATITDVLIPIVTAPKAKLTLLGDYNQLGPLLKCRDVVNFGGEKTYLDLYKNFATMLTMHYRMVTFKNEE